MKILSLDGLSHIYAGRSSVYKKANTSSASPEAGVKEDILVGVVVAIFTKILDALWPTDKKASNNKSQYDAQEVRL